MLLCADAHCAPVGGVWVVSPSVCIVGTPHRQTRRTPTSTDGDTKEPRRRGGGGLQGAIRGVTRAGTCTRVRARGLADCRPSARTSEADTLKNADGAPLHGGYYITPYIVFVSALFMLLSVLESKSI